ncbi:MAG: hypothetical protein FWD74_09385, partial [Actinomycetia bacterium]|nr:hypothetical protein [Actinomycetes bacterium]
EGGPTGGDGGFASLRHRQVGQVPRGLTDRAAPPRVSGSRVRGGARRGHRAANSPTGAGIAPPILTWAHNPPTSAAGTISG